MSDNNHQGAVLRPWTIKAMPEALTVKAVAAARRRQEPVADLVSRALARELDTPSQVVPASARNGEDKPVSPDGLEELERLARLARLLTDQGKTSKPMAEARRQVFLWLRQLADKHVHDDDEMLALPAPISSERQC